MSNAASDRCLSRKPTNVQQNTSEVEAALADTQCIREAISDVASVEDSASFGVNVESSSSSTESEDDPDEDTELSENSHVNVKEIFESLMILQKCSNNWFEFVAILEEQVHKDVASISSAAYEYITTRGYAEVNMKLLH